MVRSQDYPLPPITLVLGGIRSGKSIYAERLIADHYSCGVYVATTEFRDEEMEDRIRKHRERRGSSWEVVEEPLDIVSALRSHTFHQRPALLDCLTVWLANIVERGHDLETATSGLVSSLGSFDGPVVLVSDEVGLGGISANPLQRRFTDAAGQLNQAVAMVADRVVFVAAGLPMTLKDIKP